MSLLIAALLLASPAAPLPQEGATTDASGTVTVAPKKAKKVCRPVTRPGSHIDQTICRTPEEWAASDGADAGVGTETMPGNRATTGAQWLYRGPMDRRPPGP